MPETLVTLQVNVLGTLNLLPLRRVGFSGRMVFVSTGDVRARAG
jgi:hypothetical protein